MGSDGNALRIIRVEDYKGEKTAETLDLQREYWEEQEKRVMQGRTNRYGYLFCGSDGTKEFMWRGDTLYVRDLSYNDELFSTVEDIDDSPSVTCVCGNSAFLLFYGSYSLLAECSLCGKSQVVYDG